MAQAFKLIATIVGVLWLVSEVLCVLPEVQPHEMMHLFGDANGLWQIVSRQKIFPGVKYATNNDLGVSQRWKDFLSVHGQSEFDQIFNEMKGHVRDQGLDGRRYNVKLLFRNFLNPQTEKLLLVVSEDGQQFVARRMVNAFTDHLYQRREAERQAELAAVQRGESQASTSH